MPCNLISLRLIAAVLFLMAIAWPQQPADNKKPAPPADPCAGAQSQMEITNCWEKLASKADADLAALYQKTQKAIRAQMAEDDASMKTYRQGALEKLRSAQLAWTHYRDAQCAAAEQQFEGGSIAPSIVAGCHKELAEQRMKDLHDTYAIYLKAQ
ncbi:MAG TPA: lysozyme inhibitor LprI family protein [Candidatus Angelobacter sp.]